MGFHTGKHGKVYNDDKKSKGSSSNHPGNYDGSSEIIRADNIPDRKLTQDELQNIQIEVTDVQQENQKILERDLAKARAKGDNRPIWEIREDQINYNHKQVELWEELDGGERHAILTDLGVPSDKINDYAGKDFMDLKKMPGYGDADFRLYLSSEINGRAKIPTEWFDK